MSENVSHHPTPAPPAAAPASDQPRRVHVLVMDDEAPVRTLTMNMLEFLGYDAEVAHTGSAAVERFRHARTSSRPFDIVMLDLLVPGDIGGTEAMNQLGAIDPAVKAILMSGCGQDPELREFQAHGFQARASLQCTPPQVDRLPRPAALDVCVAQVHRRSHLRRIELERLLVQRRRLGLVSTRLV